MLVTATHPEAAVEALLDDDLAPAPGLAIDPSRQGQRPAIPLERCIEGHPADVLVAQHGLVRPRQRPRPPRRSGDGGWHPEAGVVARQVQRRTALACPRVAAPARRSSDTP